MDSASSQPRVVRFGPFEANLHTQELRKHGIRLRLPNQSFLVLSVLLERPGQMVTREELRSRLWPSDTFVEYDQGLNAAVNRLREALGDSAEKPRFIETLPRRGYRFIAAIETDTASRLADHQASESVAATASLRSSALAEEPPTPATSPANWPVVGGLRRFRWKTLSIASILIVFALLLSAALIHWKNSRVAESSGSVRTVPFTSLPGQEVVPAFSPDGSQIAFAWKGDSDKGFDLYVKTIGSERMLRLTDHPSKWISAAWSPDGSQIAFARWLPPADSGIFVIPALGGSERKLARADFWYEPFMQISWLPDARSVAYWSASETGSHVFLLLLDTLKPRVLAPELPCLDAASPALSPDGKSLALVCTSSIAVYTIYVIPMSGGTPRPLVSMMGYPRGLAWSSDGERIIFSNDSGNGGDLWQVSMDSSLAKVPWGNGGTFPAVASRGDRLAYVRGSTTIDIWRLDLNVPDSATKLIFSTLIQRDPQYSPDGTKIVFDSNRSGSSEIWLTDGNGNNPVQLTSFNGPQTGAPRWCSDGRRIAFDSRGSGLSAIYVEDIQERLPRRIQTNVENLSLPTWSTDCRWLYVSDGKSTLYRIPSSGGNATRVTEHPSYYSVVSGDRLIFNVKQSAGVELWSKLVEGGSEAPLRNMPRLTYFDAWTATSTGIYYSDSASAAIRFYDFTRQTTSQVAKLKQAPTPAGGLGWSVSPDGRWLLYTQTDDEQSDIMLVEPFQHLLQGSLFPR